MKILIYGSKGFIGLYITKYLKLNSVLDVIEGNSRCENYSQLNKEISEICPDRIICCIGRSEGKNIYSSSFIEEKLDINLRDNYFAKLTLLKCCIDNNIHFTHIGDGSIFNSEDNIELNEDEEPNLLCTSHSTVKSYFEKSLKLFGKSYLNVRLSKPITGDFNPKCFINKIISYPKIIRKNVSVSILDDILPILSDLIFQAKIGTYNLVNPGNINLIDLKILCKEKIDSNLSIEEYSEEEHNRDIGIRSNVILKTTKIQCLNPNILNVRDSLENQFDKMKNICKELKQCLCCLSPLKLLLDLGYRGLANNFHVKNQTVETYPLRLMYCQNCYHSQLSHSVNPEILFKHYLYRSDTSKTGELFFQQNAEFINTYLKLNNQGIAVDLASNTGNQLDAFKKLGFKTIGCDPATNLCPIAENKGHKIICDFWNNESASKILTEDGYVNIITAQNVFAHVSEVDKFLEACKIIMNDSTSLFIQTSQKDLILEGAFDSIYHEHCSFFNTKSMLTLCERNGLKLNNVFFNDIHGISYIFEINKINKEGNVLQILEDETAVHIYHISMYENYHLNAKRAVRNLKNEIEKYKSTHKIIGFGASAKLMVTLTYAKIDLEYIIDENPLKINLLSPELNIPVVSPDYFKNDVCDKFLILLTWNFASEIISKIKNIKHTQNVEIMVIERYFPNLNMQKIL